MNGAIPLLPLYAFMVWTGTALPLTLPGRSERPELPIICIIDISHIIYLNVVPATSSFFQLLKDFFK